jgi:hypothetical protein
MYQEQLATNSCELADLSAQIAFHSYGVLLLLPIGTRPTGLVGDLAEHVGGITIGCLRWGSNACQSGNACQHADGCTAGLRAVTIVLSVAVPS